MKIKLNTGISEEDQKKIIERLQPILADVYVAFVQARNFHWNVVGMQFGDLHNKFKSQYEMLDGLGDDLAERIRALDGIPVATMAEWLALAKIKEVSSTPRVLSAQEMLVILVSNLESVVMSMRDLCDYDDESDETPEEENNEVEIDAATETMLTAQMLDLEKQIWMLRSYLA